MSDLKNQVKELRIIQNKSLHEVAKIVGVSHTRVWQIEQEIREKENIFKNELQQKIEKETNKLKMLYSKIGLTIKISTKEQNEMKQIKNEINEINRLKYAIKETKSVCLKRDYKKQIAEIIAEIKEYCGYRNYDFVAIREKYNLGVD